MTAMMNERRMFMVLWLRKMLNSMSMETVLLAFFAPGHYSGHTFLPPRIESDKISLEVGERRGQR